jgi:hypothetical protein
MQRLKELDAVDEKITAGSIPAWKDSRGAGNATLKYVARNAS